VAAPLAGSHWTLKVEYVSDAPPVAGAPPAPQNPPPPPGIPGPDKLLQLSSLACWRDAKLTRVAASWSDGSREEGYIAGNRAYIQDTKSGKILVLWTADSADIAACAFYAGGYPGTSWITLGDYVGAESIKNKLCYKFHRAGIYNAEQAMPEMTAWIGADDKIPVRLLLGNAQVDFSPVNSWAGPVEVPAEVRARMDSASQEDRALEALRRLGNP
jgi:hypothetical protein